MSRTRGAEQSQGPGWWLASDGKWYPPAAENRPAPPQHQQPQTIVIREGSGCLKWAAIIGGTLVALAIIFAIIAAVAVDDAVDDATDGRPPRGTDPAGEVVTTVAGNPPPISFAEFQQITEGQTYDQVVEIIGSPGELISQTDVAGYSGTIYQFEGSELGGNAIVQFQDGLVISKSQYGLE